MIEQVVQLLGAFMILGGFAGLQTGRFSVNDLRYLLLNAIGSGLLFIVALIDREWGFILLEGSRTAISSLAIVRRFTRSHANAGSSHIP